MNGFKPQQLVARGVFDTIEELDRVMLELDDARKEPRVIACAWREGFSFTVPRVRSGAGAAATPPFGNDHAARVDAVPARETESRRSPESVAGAASVLCPWCAAERAMQGQGAAPRTGFVPVARCARHSAESPADFNGQFPTNRSAA